MPGIVHHARADEPEQGWHWLARQIHRMLEVCG
jgi:hypothetical protein